MLRLKSFLLVCLFFSISTQVFSVIRLNQAGQNIYISRTVSPTSTARFAQLQAQMTNFLSQRTVAALQNCQIQRHEHLVVHLGTFAQFNGDTQILNGDLLIAAMRQTLNTYLSYARESCFGPRSLEKANQYEFIRISNTPNIRWIVLRVSKPANKHFGTFDNQFVDEDLFIPLARCDLRMPNRPPPNVIFRAINRGLNKHAGLKALINGNFQILVNHTYINSADGNFRKLKNCDLEERYDQPGVPLVQ